MSRIALIDWNVAAAAAGLEALRRAGHSVQPVVPADAAKLRGLASRPPEAIVIDLARRPAEGRNVGVWLRQRRVTRAVTLLFVGGEAEKVKQTRALLPDAVYTQWRGIRAALRRAQREAPRHPVVRGSMDAYSGTPLPRKLGLRPEMRVALLGAPVDFASTLGELPEGVRFQAQLRGAPPMVLLFARSQADLARRFPAAARALATGGSLWILWRKKASGEATDLGEKEVREFGLSRGFVDYKISAIDATWSGLRFARRRNALRGSRRRGSRAR